MYNPFSLKEKTILVTGASSGIGRATAIECSKLGAKVIITARNEERRARPIRHKRYCPLRHDRSNQTKRNWSRDHARMRSYN